MKPLGGFEQGTKYLEFGTEMLAPFSGLIRRSTASSSVGDGGDFGRCSVCTLKVVTCGGTQRHVVS
jgi:hypothetical protein